MNLENIESGSIILAPDYLHSQIRESLLKHQNAIVNITIYSMETYLLKDINTRDDSDYEYYVALKKKQTKNNDLIQLSLPFIREMKNFITHTKQFQIDLNTLPMEHTLQSQLKDIVLYLSNIHLKTDDINLQLINKLNDCSNIYIINEYCDIYEKKIYDLMISNGAKNLTFKESLKTKSYYYALNKRQEIESVAQYIITHNINAKDVKISLLDASYVPYLKMIFSQYKIPFECVNESTLTFAQKKFIAFLQYYLNPCNESSIALLNASIFNTKYIQDCIDYISLYELDIQEPFTVLNNLSITNDILDKREIDRLLELEIKAAQVQEEILPIIKQLFNGKDIIDVLCFIDSYLIKNHNFSSKEEKNAILKIRAEIKRADLYLNDKQDLLFFTHIIKQIKVTKEQNVEGCIISDFKHPLPNYPYHFVLGCSQSNYPAMDSLNGIFNESYYSALNYPSLEERYNLHMHYYEKNLSTCEHLVCFYSISDFDGKANESSLELDTFMSETKATRYPLIQTFTPYKRTYEIKQTTSSQLFTKENVLIGSISAFEKYANCPYSYFLKYGLRIEEPIDYSFNNAKAGTLSHYLLEVLTSQFGKEYVSITKEKIASILDKKIQEIVTVYPNKESYLRQMEQRLLISIMKNIEVLKDHENASSLTPSYSEYHFNHEIKLENNYLLKLHGFIDRIDTNNDFFRIIDYKSSSKTLKDDYVFSALQLQLMTYLVVMENILEKRPLGAFYYSFANPNINMHYAKLKKRPLAYEFYNEDDGLSYLMKEKKLSGWITSEYIEAMDNSGSHIKGVRNSKASGINTSTIYNSKTLYVYLEEIYQLLATAIINGHIECKSVAGACLYCPYESICAKANKPYTKEEMINVDDSLYIKGGRKNAKMES